MRKFLFTACALLFTYSVAASESIGGTWSGKLQLGAQRSLKLVFHISASDSTVTMDSPDQGAKGIECEVLYLSDDSVSCRVSKMRMSYNGALADGVIEGTFKQGAYNFPLSLHRGEDKVNRPQTPVPPFPYSIESVTVANDSVSLSGTLCVPQNYSASTPVILLVSGSGLQNRDEELFEHKPFAVIADYLARNGIASLRYDDRGIGESTGDVLNATTADFAADAKMMIEWLRSKNRFGKIGLVGHSEGGQIAYMLGSKNNVLDFIVAIAGPSIRGNKTIAFQNKVALVKSGIAENIADEFATALEKAFEYKLAYPEVTEISDEKIKELYPQCNEDMFTRQLVASMKSMLAAQPSNPWMMFFLDYDPEADLKALAIPALIIYGEKDRQVPPSLNLAPALRHATGAQVKSYPELNHLMQHAVTGEVEEYSSIEETISPEVLADIAAFIKGL